MCVVKNKGIIDSRLVLCLHLENIYISGLVCELIRMQSDDVIVSLSGDPI